MMQTVALWDMIPREKVDIGWSGYRDMSLYQGPILTWRNLHKNYTVILLKLIKETLPGIFLEFHL